MVVGVRVRMGDGEMGIEVDGVDERSRGCRVMFLLFENASDVGKRIEVTGGS